MNKLYQWVDWFEELARNIADNDHEYLVERAKQVEWKSPNYQWQDFRLFKYGEENVDPFSFIYTLASLNSKASFKRVLEDITDVFKLNQKLNLDQSKIDFVIPTPLSIATLFHSGYEFNPQLLRKFFNVAVKRPESIDHALFNNILALKGVGTRSLTQALFLISPRKFLPIDDRFARTFSGKYTVPRRESDFTWSRYTQTRADVKKEFECEFFEVDHWLYLISSIVQGNSSLYQLTIDETKDSIWTEWSNESYVRINSQNKDFDRLKQGDVLLVRQGARRNKGIGIVLSKEIEGTNDAGSIVQVVWMNKRETVSDSEHISDGFSLAGKVEAVFRDESAYKLNFEILDRVISPPPAPPTDDIVSVDTISQYHRNQIFFGPPGTGKTFAAEAMAVKIIDGEQEDSQKVRVRYKKLLSDGRIKFVTFHQNYAYEDFIEGIRPKLDKTEDGTNIEYERKEGLFKSLCEKAKRDQNRAYVLIIDEINRGNISKIFGEMITLIEDSRRLGAAHETEATLPISGDRFGVPRNLYIVGTMNTADRSIQLLDTALRRRFHFEELMPAPIHSKLSKDVEGVDLRALLLAMNERISVLHDREHQIGHTYFFDVNSVQELADCFKFKVFPLLQEYFFDDWSKIRTVLGKNGFVFEKDVQKLNLGEEFQEQSETVYERISLNDETWTNPEQYKQIYK